MERSTVIRVTLLASLETLIVSGMVMSFFAIWLVPISFYVAFLVVVALTVLKSIVAPTKMTIADFDTNAKAIHVFAKDLFWASTVYGLAVLVAYLTGRL